MVVVLLLNAGSQIFVLLRYEFRRVTEKQKYLPSGESD
jgi:hypothetical protein